MVREKVPCTTCRAPAHAVVMAVAANSNASRKSTSPFHAVSHSGLYAGENNSDKTDGVYLLVQFDNAGQADKAFEKTCVKTDEKVHESNLNDWD